MGAPSRAAEWSIDRSINATAIIDASLSETRSLNERVTKVNLGEGSRDKSFFLFLSFFTPSSLSYFSFFFFFLQIPLLLVITHPRGRLLNPPSSTRFFLLRFHFIPPSFNPERPRVAEKSSSRINDFLFLPSFFDLHFEKIQANLLLSLFFSPPPHIQLFLFNSSREIVPANYNLLPSSLSSFPTRQASIVGLSRSSSSSRGLCRLHDPTVHAPLRTWQATMARFTATNNSTDPSKSWDGRGEGGHLFHARPKPDRFARGSRFFLGREFFLPPPLVFLSRISCTCPSRCYPFLRERIIHIFLWIKKFRTWISHRGVPILFKWLI